MLSENGKLPSWINSDGFECQKCAGITFSNSFWKFTWILWLWYKAVTGGSELMSASYDWWYEPRYASWRHVISDHMIALTRAQSSRRSAALRARLRDWALVRANHMSIFIRWPQLAPFILLGNLLLKSPKGVCLSVCNLTNVTLWIIMWK